MSWFPIIAAELESIENQLGVALPARYKALLGDERIQRILTHPTIGALTGQTMQIFVDVTQRIRKTTPGFPPDAVVATLPEGRYFRFWMPDGKTKGVLGEMIYAWDTVNNRKTRDCTSEEWVVSMIDCLYQSEPDFLAQVGYPPPVVKKAAPLFQIRPCDNSLARLLGLRGTEAIAALAASTGQWLTCADMEIKGRTLVPCDLGQIPEASSSRGIKVTPGLYRAEVRLSLSRHGEWPVIAALRLIREGYPVTRTQRVVDIDIDLAAVAICDRQAFCKQIPLADREAFVEDLVALSGFPCVISSRRNSGMLIIIPSGEGDGTYPIAELRSHDEIVGLEIDFAQGE